MKPRLTTLLAATAASLTLAQDRPRETLLLSDPLTSAAKVSGEAAKAARGGEFSPRGWRALANGDFLMVELSESTGFEGALEVDLTDLDWAAANTHVSRDKIHFLNMFSSPRADHHIEHGGTNQDALWTLRAGKAPDGSPAYGNRFAVLWASRGAKRADPSDYEESVAPMVPGWKWDQERYKFRVEWSRQKAQLLGYINGQLVFHEPWANQVKPLQFIYLAKGPEFHTFVGPRYSNLKVYRGDRNQPGSNQNPVVSIVSPRTGTVAAQAATIEIAVDAEDDGRISRIELIEAANTPRSLGVMTSPPYRFRLPKMEQGWYQFIAKATDDAGLTAESRPVYVTVGSPWKPWGLEHAAGAHIEEKGLVVMEAESASPTSAWRFLRRAAGYKGEGYLEWTSDTEGKQPGLGVLTYQFRVQQAGDYQVLFRSRLKDPANRPETLDPSGNDTWLRFATGTPVPGQAPVPGWSKIAILGHPPSWTWNTNADQGAPHPLTPVCRRYEPGLHRIELSGRSPGHAIDRIVLRRYESSPAKALTPEEESRLDSAPVSRRE